MTVEATPDSALAQKSPVASTLGDHKTSNGDNPASNRFSDEFMKLGLKKLQDKEKSHDESLKSRCGLVDPAYISNSSESDIEIRKKTGNIFGVIESDSDFY